MTNELIDKTNNFEILEKVIIGGDLSKLTSQERCFYYMKTCESLCLNPLTRPFEYINLNGKLTFYARKECTDQLRKNNQISVTKIEKEVINDIYIVTVHGQTPNGRCDVGTGAVNIKGLSGDSLANAIMKCESKAKRRFALSICGLGMLDESELETIKDKIQFVKVDDEHNIINEKPLLESKNDDLIKCLNNIRNSSNMDDLKLIYKELRTKFINDKDSLHLIMEAAKTKKFELEPIKEAV